MSIKNAQNACRRIAEAARSFGQGAPQADDITVLTVARPVQHQEAFA